MAMPPFRRSRTRRQAFFHALILTACFLASFNAPSQSSSQSPSDQDANLRQADAAFHAGYAAAQNGDLTTARQDFQTVVRLAPEIAEGHSALGSVLLQLGEGALAIPELERALALRPEDHSAEVNLAVAYEQTQSYDKSLSLFQSLDQAPEASLPASAILAYARALAATRQPDQALARLQKAVADAPSDTVLLDALGTVEAQRQDWRAAQAHFEQALALDPNLADAHLHLGVTLLAQRHIAEAVKELTVASELSPQNSPTLIELGKALIAASEDEKAIPILQRALALTPDSVDGKYQLALALQGSSEEQQAIPLFRQVVEAEPHNAPALTNLALALVQTGKSKEAIPLYQRALAETSTGTSDAALVHQDLGVAYLQESNLDDAAREFRAGLQLAPDSYELHYNLGLALKLKDDAAAATGELQQAARLNPDSPDPPYTLGILDMQQGRFDDAVQQLKLTLKMRPNNGDGWAVLGSIYKQQNHLPEAVNALREAVRLLPNQPGPHITLSGVLAQQGQKEEAAAERKVAADLTHVAVNRQRATFAANTGNLMLQQDKVTDAIERFQEAVASDPSYIEAHRGLAAALARSGRNAEADAERQKIVDLEKK